MKIVLTFVITLLVQLGWHWAITWHNNFSESALRIYLIHNEHNRKGLAGYMDLVLPALIAGILIGRLGWQLKISKLCGYTLSLGILLVALRPFYALMIGFDKTWWWPVDQKDVLPFLIGNTIGATAALGVFVYGGRTWKIEGR